MATPPPRLTESLQPHFLVHFLHHPTDLLQGKLLPLLPLGIGQGILVPLSGGGVQISHLQAIALQGCQGVIRAPTYGTAVDVSQRAGNYRGQRCTTFVRVVQCLLKGKTTCPCEYWTSHGIRQLQKLLTQHGNAHE